MSFVTDFAAEIALRLLFGDSDHPEPTDCLYISNIDEKPLLIRMKNIPAKSLGMIRLIIVSDTHEKHRKIKKVPDGDVFIHCGDVLLTSRFFSVRNGKGKLAEFNEWLKSIPCRIKIVIGGNHDNVLEHLGKDVVQSILTEATYLEDNSFMIGNITIWGTPLSSGRSRNKAFQSKRFAAKTISEVPAKVDILLTHGQCPQLEKKVKHSVHLWGHAHNAYGVRKPPKFLRGQPVVSLSICAPILDKKFRPVHYPIVLDIPADSARLDQLTQTSLKPPVAARREEVSFLDDDDGVESKYNSEDEFVASISPVKSWWLQKKKRAAVAPL
jgi:predicted phosphodiesterase